MQRLPVSTATTEGRYLFATTFAQAAGKLRVGEGLVIVLDWTAAVCPDEATWQDLAQTGSQRFDPYAVPAHLLSGGRVPVTGRLDGGAA